MCQIPALTGLNKHVKHRNNRLFSVISVKRQPFKTGFLRKWRKWRIFHEISWFSDKMTNLSKHTLWRADKHGLIHKPGHKHGLIHKPGHKQGLTQTFLTDWIVTWLWVNGVDLCLTVVYVWLWLIMSDCGLCLTVVDCVFVGVYPRVCRCLSACVCRCLSACPSVMSDCPRVRVWCLIVHVSVVDWLYTRVSVVDWLYTRVSECLIVWVSACPSVWLSDCLIFMISDDFPRIPENWLKLMIFREFLKSD